MFEINGRRICENCFRDCAENTCRFCGYTANSGAVAEYAMTPGTIVYGKYIVGKPLKNDGFAITYLAYAIADNANVCVKEYFPTDVAQRIAGSDTVAPINDALNEVFTTGAVEYSEESKKTARFNGHPNITSVLDVFFENNTTYLVYDGVDGADLRTYVRQRNGKLSEKEVLGLAEQTVNALTAIHSAGLYHANISPDSIFITKGGIIKLADFGAARFRFSIASSSKKIVPKHGISPMELYQKSVNIGQWTDFYSLGATMYFCLTGKTPEGVVNRMESDPVPAEIDAIVGVSVPFKTILKKMLSIAPEQRYADDLELKRDLTAAKSGGAHAAENAQNNAVFAAAPPVVPKAPASRHAPTAPAFQGAPTAPVFNNPPTIPDANAFGSGNAAPGAPSDSQFAVGQTVHMTEGTPQFNMPQNAWQPPVGAPGAEANPQKPKKSGKKKIILISVIAVVAVAVIVVGVIFGVKYFKDKNEETTVPVTEVTTIADTTVETTVQPTTAAPASTVALGDFSCAYTEDGNIIIMSYQGTEAELTIPADIDGKAVTQIGAGAFKDNKTVTSVTVPESVTKISSDAFIDSAVTTLSILNKECVIEKNAVPAEISIKGYVESTAEEFATANNIKFETITE